MRRVVFLMLAILIVSISMYGDIGKGDWTQEEINYFSNREYKGDKINYNFLAKWVAPYGMPGLTEGRFIGYGGDIQSRISKLILIGKLDKNTEFKYLSLLRNEIHARNGYIFKDAGLKAFFNQMPWYKPISEDIQLNRHERYNVRKIGKLEGKLRAIVGLKAIDPDTFPEKYTGRVIIDAKWGDKKGEYKFFEYGYRQGPFTFAVDDKGNIYVGDYNNGEIKKYNRRGKLLNEFSNMAFHNAKDIVVNSSGHIYISTADRHNGRIYNEILKYNQKTGKGESFWYAENSFNTKVQQNRILVIKDDNIILDTKEFYKRVERGIMQVDIDYITIGKDGSAKLSNYIDKSKEISIDIPRIFDKKCKHIELKNDNYMFYITYLGRDKKGNIYMNCEYEIIPEFRDSNVYHNVKCIVYKLSLIHI